MLYMLALYVYAFSSFSDFFFKIVFKNPSFGNMLFMKNQSGISSIPSRTSSFHNLSHTSKLLANPAKSDFLFF